MTQLTPFERRLGERLAADLGSALRPFDAQAIATAAVGTRRTRVENRGLVLAVAVALAAAIVGMVAVGAKLLVVQPSPTASATASPPSPTVMPEPARPAGFVAAASLAVPRAEHFAVALLDGSVLVGGGRGPVPAGSHSSASYWDTTERWSPPTGSWTSSAPLVKANDVAFGGLTRVGQSAFTLPDGRVLVVPAGCACSPMPDLPAEIWSETQGAASVSESPTLHLARVGLSATLLSDGRILIVGGVDTMFASRAESLVTAEIWDPVSGTITRTGSMRDGRAGQVATLLADGRVLVFGGWKLSDMRPVAGGEIWDPGSGTFATADALRGLVGSVDSNDANPAVGEARLVTLADGRVLLLDGRTAKVWDPVTSSLEDAGAFLVPRRAYAAVLLPDGRVLIVGGEAGGQPVGAAEAWDPATQRFTSAGTLSTPRSGPTATVLADGRVLIVGGFMTETAPTDAVELWTPAAAR